MELVDLPPVQPNSHAASRRCVRDTCECSALELKAGPARSNAPTGRAATQGRRPPTARRCATAGPSSWPEPELQVRLPPCCPDASARLHIGMSNCADMPGRQMYEAASIVGDLGPKYKK